MWSRKGPCGDAQYKAGVLSVDVQPPTPTPTRPSTGTDLSVTCSADMRHLNPRLSQPGALGTYAEVGEWEGGRANQWSKRNISSLSARLIQRNLSECREFHSPRPFQTSGALHQVGRRTPTHSPRHTQASAGLLPPCLVSVFFSMRLNA